MNQILVTKKLYITPELRRKQTLYKFCFFLCVFLIGILFSFYIYGVYEQNMNEGLAQEIFGSVLSGATTPVKSENDILVVYLDEEVSDEQMIEIEPIEEEPDTLPSTYIASNGKEYSIVGLIRIPVIDLEYPILAETTDALLRVSVCKFVGPEPNTVGNLCIAGHNFSSTRAFSNLYKLENDDIIQITDLSGQTLEYRVYDQYIVTPTDLRCTNQQTFGKKEVTLITCTNGTSQRRIIKATEVKSLPIVTEDIKMP